MRHAWLSIARYAIRNAGSFNSDIKPMRIAPVPRIDLHRWWSGVNLRGPLLDFQDAVTRTWGQWFERGESDVESHVLIYDVLREESNHPVNQLLRRHATLVGSGIFLGRLYDLGRYPGAVRSTKKSQRVLGDVYRCQPGVPKFLDAYEGRRFRRERVDVSLGAGRHQECWTYLYNGNTARRKLISSGNYAEYRSSAQLNASVKLIEGGSGSV